MKVNVEHFFLKLRPSVKVVGRSPVVFFGGLFVVVGVAAIGLVVSRINTSQAPSASRAQTVSGRRMRILEVRYIPPQSVVPLWNTTTQNVDQHVESLSVSTKNAIVRASQWHNTGTPEVSGIDIVSNNGQPYIIRGARPSAIDAYLGLHAILDSVPTGETATICDLAVNNNVDQVWLWVDSTVDLAPGFESFIFMLGSLNSGEHFCGDRKSFITMGFDYSRGLTESLHSFSHMMEHLLTFIQGPELFINRYQGVDYQPPGKVDGIPIPGYLMSQKCGNVHVPPNIPLANGVYNGGIFDSSNPAEFNSCADWNPDGTGATQTVNKDTWTSMNTDISDEAAVKYYLWWLQNMPNPRYKEIFYQGKVIPSWFSFLINFDQTVGDMIRFGYQVNNANYEYWLDPFFLYPILSKETTSTIGETSATGGLSTTFTLSDQVLGAQSNTEEPTPSRQPAVLAASQFSNVAVLSIAYRANQNNSVSTAPKVTSINYCGITGTRIQPTPTPTTVQGGVPTYLWRSGYYYQAVELWYVKDPPTRTPANPCSVTVTWDKEVGERNISVILLKNIDLTTRPLYALAGEPYFYKDGSRTYAMKNSYAYDSQMFCTISTFPENGKNILTLVNPANELWRKSGTQLLTASALTTRRLSTLATPHYLTWSATLGAPYAEACMYLRLSPASLISASAYGSAPPVATPTPSPTNLGIKGDYYNGVNFTTFKGTRTDSAPRGSWGSIPPLTGMTTDQFSIRWTGYLKPTFDGIYKLEFLHNDGIRVWVDNVKVIDKWVNTSTNLTSTANVTLTAGQTYPLKVEFYENTYSALITPYWSHTNISRVIIPNSQFKTAP